ncbi:hypothetical protein ACS5PK_07270 [Roseateles sp. DB2]|uniref:hypothetical protein n=1 Tax=Roseateles sp. DB2 TaxID=3453717 RepID=UPI003EEF5672
MNATARRPLPTGLRLALPLALLNLLLALAGGLQRLGGLPTSLSFIPQQALQHHGMLMLGGFFATLISLERAAALGRGFAVPLTCGLAGPALLAGQTGLAQGLWAAAALGLLGLYLWAGHSRAWSLPLAIEASASLPLLLAVAAQTPGADFALRWNGSLFLLLTIAGERRELCRLLPLSAMARRSFLMLWAALLATGALSLWQPGLAARLAWPLLLALALWLLLFDIARHQWRAKAWAGHTARCLLLGYAWAAAAALAGLLGLPLLAWHWLWLGFVMAMVFGHAPIMLPALLRLQPRYSPWALAPLGLMAMSLLLRALGQQGLAASLLLPGAAWLHGLALLAFALLMAGLCRRPQR